MKPLETLNDIELMAIFIGSSAQALLDQFHDLRRLSQLTAQELMKIQGIGHVKALKIKACLEISRRIQQIPLSYGETLSDSATVFRHFHQQMRDEKREIFYSLLLDTKNRLIKKQLISVGSLNLSIVHPREVFCNAIRESAASVLLIHNHPSGDPTPSTEDIQVTQRLTEVGNLVGIKVLDHIIIGENRYVSLSRL